MKINRQCLHLTDSITTGLGLSQDLLNERAQTRQFYAVFESCVGARSYTLELYLVATGLYGSENKDVLRETYNDKEEAKKRKRNRKGLSINFFSYELPEPLS